MERLPVNQEDLKRTPPYFSSSRWRNADIVSVRHVNMLSAALLLETILGKEPDEMTNERTCRFGTSALGLDVQESSLLQVLALCASENNPY